MKWKLRIQHIITPEADHTDDVCEWIKQNGGASLAKTSMHWASRDKFLRELLLDDEGQVAEIPEDLQGLVKVYEKIVVR